MSHQTGIKGNPSKSVKKKEFSFIFILNVIANDFDTDK